MAAFFFVVRRWRRFGGGELLSKVSHTGEGCAYTNLDKKMENGRVRRLWTVKSASPVTTTAAVVRTFCHDHQLHQRRTQLHTGRLSIDLHGIILLDCLFVYK